MMMKIKLYLLMFFSVAMLACSDDDSAPIIMMNDNDLIDIGMYTLLEESLSIIPYKIDSTVVFVDSAGTELRFKITSQDLFSGGSARLYKYNVNIEGDTVMYLYSSQYKHAYLRNEEKSINFRATLSARPLYSDPESRSVADIYEIFCALPDNSNTSSQVFFETINQRTWPTSTKVKVLGEVEIFGKTFENVRMKEFSNPKSVVLFNYELGIVSFSDHDDMIWRFERYE